MKRVDRHLRTSSWLIAAAIAAILAAAVVGQVRPFYDEGSAGLLRLLKRMNTTRSVLMIGAHPDDESNDLLAYLARGRNVRTAYLSLTRGDGGQNAIGPELGDALGVLRTEELLQARKIDGAEQYFGRAYDFGFSKTLAETRAKWDEAVIMCDTARVIREMRPTVVIALFSGTPADGHGHHQFAGYIAPKAIAAAADPSKCAGAGTPWRVPRAYVRHGRTRPPDERTVLINTGEYDAGLGRTYFQIAMESRSQHRSQQQGGLELDGTRTAALNPLGPTVAAPDILESADEPFAGNADDLRTFRELAQQALQRFDARSPRAVLPFLLDAFAVAEKLRGSSDASVRAFAEQRHRVIVSAIRIAAGIRIDAVTGAETVVPGGSLEVSVRAFYPGGAGIEPVSAMVDHPKGWRVHDGPAKNEAAREKADLERNFTVDVPANAAITEPYWLRRPRRGEMFDVGDEGSPAAPFEGPELSAKVRMRIDGREIEFTVPVEFRFADPIRGEIRRPVAVVPAVTIAIEPQLFLVRSTAVSPQKITVKVTNNTPGPISGSLLLDVPPGWSAAERRVEFAATRRGEVVTREFTLGAPPRHITSTSDRVVISARAIVGGSEFTRSVREIAYPHVQTHRIYSRAQAVAVVADVRVPKVRVGYIPGTGDLVPEAIRQLGIEPATIDPATLATADLSGFDAIVVGIRAYQAHPELAAANGRLLDFISRGGTLIVQYQLPDYTQRGLAPYPASQGPRTTDENAAVGLLRPDHPVLNFPNKIVPQDLQGWVQERNLYNFSTMDPRYTGLLETHDAGEPANDGGLVVAGLGRGRYIYCSYSLFRQLPAGVGGAYRLLANMLSVRQPTPLQPGAPKKR